VTVRSFGEYASKEKDSIAIKYRIAGRWNAFDASLLEKARTATWE
jgi:hypothetical protein